MAYTYNFITHLNSPNYTAGRAGKAIGGDTPHWWGEPANNPSFEGVCSWLCNPRSQVSAHYVVTGTGRRVACLVDLANTAWHAGNWTGNTTTIGIEMDPRCRDEDYDTAAELIAELWLWHGRKPLYPHRHWTSTRCLPLNTELLTKNGWVKLKDISVNDEVATPRIDDMSIIFSPVRRVVPVHKKDTWQVRGIEVTNDHNMVFKNQNGKYQLSQFQDMYNKSKKYSVYIPTAGEYSGEGLDLTDAELKLLVATQADGHYMYENRIRKDGVRIKTDNKKYYGVEFHLKKSRKIERIVELLEDAGFEFNTNEKIDGTVAIRVYDRKLLELAFKWLDNKNFTWKMLELSPRQAKVFLDELLLWDGCTANMSYSSNKRINIDIVSAIASINGVGVSDEGNRVYFKNPHRTINPATETKRRNYQKDVSCVTVDTGLILVRQHGRTTIVGNCPGNYDLARLEREAEAWYRRKTQPAAPAKPTITWIPMDNPRKLIAATNLRVINLSNNQPVGDEIKAGTVIDFNTKCAANGTTYLRTVYSTSKGFNHGIDIRSLKEVPAPEPPKPEWVRNLKDIEDVKLTVLAAEGVRVLNLTNLQHVNDTIIPRGTQIDIAKETTVDGKKYYLSSYAVEKGLPWGITADKLGIPAAPPANEKPEWLKNLKDIEDKDMWTRSDTPVLKIENGDVVKTLPINTKVRITHATQMVGRDLLVIEGTELAIETIYLNDKPVENPNDDLEKRLTALEKIVKAIVDFLAGIFKNFKK